MTGGVRPYDAPKRVLDIASSGLCLVLLSPLMAAVAVSVAVKLGSPVLFAQDRPGKNGRIFKLYKFRTMRSPDPSSALVTDQQRMTPFGDALRATSLDELPTLLNVFRGDMSMVGPRPLLVQYLERYSAVQSRRHEVRPGVSGLAQVCGRNSLSWERKLELDVEYVDRRSFMLDVWILFRTVGRVMGREGISAEGHVTMPEFTGPSSGKGSL